MRHLFLATFFLLAACSSESDVEPTLSSIQQHVFDVSCALGGCHDAANEPHRLSLRSGEAYDHLVGVAASGGTPLKRVEPGQPDKSFLVRKIEGPTGSEGQRMPVGRPALPVETIQAIRDWIKAGAKND